MQTLALPSLLSYLAWQQWVHSLIHVEAFALTFEALCLQEWEARTNLKKGLSEIDVLHALIRTFDQWKEITAVYHTPAKQSLSPAEADFKRLMDSAEIMLASSLGLTLSKYPQVSSYPVTVPQQGQI